MDQFEAFFKRADLDGDGQISGAEAVAFFQGFGLPKQVLAQVWMYADSKKLGYLGRHDFYNALKLVTVAQSKRDLTPDMVKAALYGPASAKIPAPQINLAATPAPNVAATAPQLVGSPSAAAPNTGIRPPQLPGNATTNQQYLPSQQNQFIRSSQPVPPGPASYAQQLHPGQGIPKGGTMTTPSTPNSSISTDWLGGSAGGPTSQISSNRGISRPVAHDGFGQTTSGFMPSVQPRPQVATGQTPSNPLKPQDATMVSNQLTSKNSKAMVLSGNGFASDSSFGDVFSATPVQPTQSSSPAASAVSTLPTSSAIVPPSIGTQPSAKPSPPNTLQGAFSQQSVGGQSNGTQNQQFTSQITAAPPTGLPVGAASNQSQPPWPKITHPNIQKYMKVFLQVDADRDGKITGEQARNLFLSWRLPREVLKEVWDLSDQDNDSMLSLREFCIALYLMERYREGRPLPKTLPSSITSDETLLSITSYATGLYGSGSRGPASGVRPPHVTTVTRPTPAAAPRPPRPPTVSHVDEKPYGQQKPKVPVLEKHIVDQLSQEEQDSLNSKFQEASQADKKVEELEKEISDARQKTEFFRAKMQELILYKSRCDNRLNEVTARVSTDKHEVEALAKNYEEKYKQVGDVASRLTIEEATFRDVQEKKMELYRAIVKIEEGDISDGVLKDRAERIQSSLEDLVKTVSERCKQYGLRAKPTSLVELPFGWQHGIQEGAADWNEHWDKLEDEGFTFVKELTLDVQNVMAPPKTKSSIVRNETATTKGDKSVCSNAEAKLEKVPSSEKETENDQSEDGIERSPSESPSGRSGTESQSHEFQTYPFRESIAAEGLPHTKEIRSDICGTDSVVSGDKCADEHGWGTFHDDAASAWGFDSVSGKDLDRERQSDTFSIGEFGLSPIRTGASHVDNLFQGKGPVMFDSVPSTPAYNQGQTSIMFDSVPSTPAYNTGKSSYLFADSVPGTPAYNHGKSSFAFEDSVPSTPAYNFGNSDDHAFDSFSKFDSFGNNDGSLVHSPQSLARFDSIRSSGDSDQGYGFPTRFDSFRESKDSDLGFSRFDSFKESSDKGHGFSRFDSFRDSNQSQGFAPSFDSFRESGDSDHTHGFTRFDSFGGHEGDFFKSSGSSLARFDSVHGPRDSDSNHWFPSFDDTDPFGSSGTFKTATIDSETPKKSSDNWRAF